MKEKINYTTAAEHNLVVSLEIIDGAVVLMIDREEIAYFSDKGLVLLPDCSHNNNIPTSILDERGYLNIEKG
jgi:hypothetical protein